MYGALDYASGRMVWRPAATKDCPAFVRFWDDLAAAFPDGQAVVVLDHVGYHHSHDVRRGWVAHADRIRPLWLPACAPELNRRERGWRQPKDKLANYRWRADLPLLQRATDFLLDHTTACFHRPAGIITLYHPVRSFGQAA